MVQHVMPKDATSVDALQFSSLKVKDMMFVEDHSGCVYSFDILETQDKLGIKAMYYSYTGSSSIVYLKPTETIYRNKLTGLHMYLNVNLNETKGIIPSLVDIRVVESS